MSPTTALLLAVSALAQANKDIGKAHKEPYVRAAEDCHKAEGLLESDPGEAVRILDPICDSKKIDSKECRLRIEMAPGTWSARFDFFPHQFRGRARLKLARGEKPQAAIPIARAALEDFKESVRRGLGGSKAFQDEAESLLRELEKAVSTTEDPETAFRTPWKRLIDTDQYRAAKVHVEKEGGNLPPEKRAQFLGDTAAACKRYVDRHVSDFVIQLSRNNLKALRGMGPGDLTFVTFVLPAPERIIDSTPALDWCRALLTTLSKLAAGDEALADVLAHAVKALDAFERDDAFLGSTSLAYEIVREAVEQRVGRALEADGAERKILRGQLDAILGRWGQFEKSLRAWAGEDRKKAARFDAIIASHRGNIDTFSRKFPIDAAEVESVVADLRNAATADDPEGALAAIEKRLDGLLERLVSYPRDSRQEIVSHKVIVAALRRLLEGETPDAIALSLRRDLGAERRAYAIAKKAEPYGARVADVFNRLK